MSGAKNVVICTTLYPLEKSRSSKGQPFAVRDLVEEGIRQGLNVKAVMRFLPIVTRKRISLPKVTRVNGVAVIDCPRIGIRGVFFRTPTRIMCRILLAWLNDEVKPDKIVCHTALDYVYARRILINTTASWVYVIHGSDFKHKQELTRALATANLVFARSYALQRRLFLEYDRNVDGIVFSGVSSEYFNYEKKSSDELRLIVVCSLIKLKNVGSVVQSVALLRKERPWLKLRLDIYGDGPLRRDLNLLATKLGLTEIVQFHGFQPSRIVIRALSNAHMFLMPSAPETFGLAFLEALANGCVVVGHKGWGIDGVIEPGIDGFVVNEPSPNCIAEAMIRYLDSNREEMHENAFSKSREYSLENAGANYFHLIAA